MDEITLRLRTEKEARIIIGKSLIGEIGSIIANMYPYKVMVVADKNVPKTIIEHVVQDLKTNDLDTKILLVPGGERVKSLSFIDKLWRLMIDNGLTRKSFIVVVGGGTLLDSVGFAASTYMRGCKLVYIPTTTLSQVDVAIGGKTSINIGNVKNIVGTFYHADIVLIDPSILLTLSHEIYLSGFSEVVKHAIIEGIEGVKFLENRIAGIIERDLNVLEEVVKFSVMVKLNIVEQDYVEDRNIRTVLNFGHTIGHAIESATNYSIPHGYAVSIGLVIESYIANGILGFPREDVERIVRILKLLGLPTKPMVSSTSLLKAMRTDKKFLHGKPVLPLPRKLGLFETIELEWRDIELWVKKLIH